MRILVSNDDGVDAAGIRMLASVLREAGHEVTVVAPDRDRSGASNSLTLDLPIRLKRIDHYTVSVAGTPTDCVHLALTGLLEFEPDIVVSGINNAANLGDDVIYSGTVSAAMEGRFLGLPAVAVSLVTRNHDPKHFDTAARAAVEIVARLKPIRCRPTPSSTSTCRICRGARSRASRSPASATAIVPKAASRRRIRAATRCTGSARPGASRTPAGHRLPRGAYRPHLDHPDPGGPDPLPGAGESGQLGGWPQRRAGPAGMSPRLRLQPEAVGIGMTSQRVRDRLVDRLREAGIVDESTLNAIRVVPRHLFIDEALASRAYEDTALPIGHGQTISQPWVVARMTEAVLQVAPKRVLEVGTGSGYQAAILGALGLEVYTVERIGDLLRQARKRFRALGMNIRTKHDDGRAGWAEHGPFDAIVVTAAAPALVDELVGQLAEGGAWWRRWVARGQSLVQLDRKPDGSIEQRVLAPVTFVPLLSGMLD